MKLLPLILLGVFTLQGPETKSLQGTWVAVAYDQHGKEPPAELVKKMRFVFKGDRFTISPRLVAEYKSAFAGKPPEVAFVVDPAQSEAAVFKLQPDKGHIDLVWTGSRGETKTTHGMYALEDGVLRICFPVTNNKRPKKMPDVPKAGFLRMVLVRASE